MTRELTPEDHRAINGIATVHAAFYVEPFRETAFIAYAKGAEDMAKETVPLTAFMQLRDAFQKYYDVVDKFHDEYHAGESSSHPDCAICMPLHDAGAALSSSSSYLPKNSTENEGR